MKNGTFTYGTTPIDVIKKALRESNDTVYPMELVGEDRDVMTEIIGQGIDAHLEAFTESDFKDNGRRLYCKVGHNDMLILLRRLNESSHEAASSLRSGLLSTLEIEEI